MARPPSKHPTELELEILKILWRDGRLTGREVRDALADESRDLAYTSVMTILGIMHEKKYVSRRKKGSGFVYFAKVTEASTKQGMLSDLVSRAFDGSTMAAMVNLLKSSDIEADELEELRKLIRDRRKELGDS